MKLIDRVARKLYVANYPEIPAGELDFEKLPQPRKDHWKMMAKTAIHEVAKPLENDEPR